MCSCYGREGEQDCLNLIWQLSCGELLLLCVANDVSGMLVDVVCGFLIFWDDFVTMS